MIYPGIGCQLGVQIYNAQLSSEWNVKKCVFIWISALMRRHMGKLAFSLSLMCLLFESTIKIPISANQKECLHQKLNDPAP
jgi:hypothetical protein